MGTRSFSEVKNGRGVTLTPHPLLVPLVMKGSSYTSTSPLWAVRPVQSLSACTGVHFTFTFHPRFWEFLRQVMKPAKTWQITFVCLYIYSISYWSPISSAVTHTVCSTLHQYCVHILLFWLLVQINHLNDKLNPICHLQALLGAHRILHISRTRVKLTFRNRGSYI